MLLLQGIGLVIHEGEIMDIALLLFVLCAVVILAATEL